MSNKITTVAALFVIGVSSIVLAGTPCPDPQSYQIVEGGPVYSTFPPNILMSCKSDVLNPKGGCVSPGNNSKECEAREVLVNLDQWKSEVFLGGPVCLDQGTATEYGKIAYNSTRNCDYCRPSL